MGAGSYTWYDLLATLYLVLLFVPIFIVPGYLAGWFTQVFNYRQLPFSWRMLTAVPLSIGVAPILIFWTGKFLPWLGVGALFWLGSVCLAFLLCGYFGHESPKLWVRSLKRVPKFIWKAAAFWFLIALLSLVDLQFGNRLYFSVVTWDWSIRTAITDAITREGVQPTNPFYGLTTFIPLRYHYFWFLPCSLAGQWSGLQDGSRLAMNASSIWCGWGLMALIALYLRLMLRYSGAALCLRTKIGICLLAVTGLDIVPSLVNIRHHVIQPDMEWWNWAGQVTSWLNSLLWVPHNVGALVTALTGFAVLWSGGLATGRRAQIYAGCLGGLILGSMVGDSIYVALVFAAFLTVWTMVLFVSRDFRRILPLLIAGPVTTGLTLPYLLKLAGQSSGATFISFGVRRFNPSLNYADQHQLDWMKSNLLYLGTLPCQYMFELGFFGLVAFLYFPILRRNLAQPGARALLTMILVALPIVTFLQSSVVGTNDLGWRGFLPIQFVLLLWGADLLATSLEKTGNVSSISKNSLLQAATVLSLVIGFCSTVYGLAILRSYGLLADAGFTNPLFIRSGNLGETTMGLRQGYARLQKLLPSDAVIQSNPQWQVYDYFLGIYSHRRTAALNMTCGVELGGDVDACKQNYPVLEGIFNRPESFNASDVRAVAQRLKIRALIVYRGDPAWGSVGWTQEMTPTLATNSMRAYILKSDGAKPNPLT